MVGLRRLWQGLAVAILVSTGAATSPAQTARPAGETRILLVGVGAYPALPPNNQLQGPRNDVMQMRDLFRRRGIPADAMRVLGDNIPGGHGVPTRARIEEELARLVTWSKGRSGGDTVILFLSGHGSRQPTSDPEEGDGRAEVFLPRDIGRDPGDGTGIANAIPIKRIGEIAREISATGTRVWVILDSCFAGTGLRSTETAALKYIDPALLGVRDGENPEKPVDRTFEAARATRAVDLGSTTAKAEPARVYFYSSQAHETSRELDIATGSGRPVRRSAFTHAIATTLSRDPNLTFRDLFEETKRAMRGRGGLGVTQTPGFDGVGLDEPVPGARETERTDQFVLDGQAIRAGQLQGLDAGSIVALYDDLDAPDDKPIGHARIRAADATDSTYELVNMPCTRGPDGWECRQSGDSSPAQRAKVVRLLYPAMPFAMTVSPPRAGGGSDELMVQANRIAATLADAASPAFGRVRVTADAPDLVWLVTPTGFRFVPAALDADAFDTGPAVTLVAKGEIEPDDATNQTVRALLRSHLVILMQRLAGSAETAGTTRQAALGVDMKVRPGRFDRATRACAPATTAEGTDETRVPLCGGVTLTVTNRATRAQYVTLMAVTERWNLIDLAQVCKWPTGTGARLAPGEARACVLPDYRPSAAGGSEQAAPFLQHMVIALSKPHVDGASPPNYTALRRFNDAAGATRAADLAADVVGGLVDAGVGTRSLAAGPPTSVQMLGWTVDRR
jgi:hypothetical protein